MQKGIHTSTSPNQTLNISQFPFHWLIHICQFLDEKDLYHFEQTCRSIQKAAKDPNALYAIECSIREYFGRYTRNARYNKAQSIIIKKEDSGSCFPARDMDKCIQRVVNIFPNLHTLTLSIKRLNHYGHEYKSFHMFLQELCKVLSMPRDHGKLAFNISVIHSARDFLDWALGIFDLSKNSLIPKVLLNIQSLTFNIGFNIKCLDRILSTIDSLQMDDKIFRTVRCYVSYHVGSMVQEPDNEHFWNQFSRLNKYCENVHVFINYNYQNHATAAIQSYKSDWEEFIRQLIHRKLFELVQIKISFEKEHFPEFQKHLNGWFRITQENMREIGLKDLEIMIQYLFVDNDWKMKMLEPMKTFCKECIDSSRMVESENLNVKTKYLQPNHPVLRYTVKL